MKKKSQRADCCAVCEAPLPVNQGSGRPRRYCSESCKKAAQRTSGNGGNSARGKKLCRHCGGQFQGEGPYCSDRCYYHASSGFLPWDRRHLAAWDEVLIPTTPTARPAWHAWVYGGARRPDHEGEDR